MRLVSAGAFVATMRAERMQCYELHLREVDRHSVGDGRMAAGPKRTVPEP